MSAAKRRPPERPTVPVEPWEIVRDETVASPKLEGPPPMSWVVRPSAGICDFWQGGEVVRRLRAQDSLLAWILEGLRPESVRMHLDPVARPAFDALVAELHHRFQVVMEEYERLEMKGVVSDAGIRRTQHQGRAKGAARARAAKAELPRADLGLLKLFTGMKRREELSDRAIAKRLGVSRRKVARIKILARSGS